MTREERDNAAEVLGNMLSDIADNKLYGIKRDEINAILRSIIVLRDYKPKPAQHEQVSPTTQPDPDTGLVPCGCGGKARASTLSGRDDWFVECIKCHTTTYSNSKEGAEEKWDRAMGLLEVEE